MKFRFFCFLSVGFWVFAFPGSGNVTILTQANCPLEITTFSAVFQPETSGLYGHIDRISFSVKLTNTSGKRIVAYRMGFVTFDVFNEFLNKMSGWAIEKIDPGKSGNSSWADSSYGCFKFENYGTAVVYVDAVRFEDGTFWLKAEDEVIPQLQNIEKGFTKEKLQDKAPGQR